LCACVYVEMCVCVESFCVRMLDSVVSVF